MRYLILNTPDALIRLFEINEIISNDGTLPIKEVSWKLSEKEKESIKTLFKEKQKDESVITYDYFCPNCNFYFQLPIIYVKNKKELKEEDKDKSKNIHYCTCHLSIKIASDEKTHPILQIKEKK